MITMKTILKIMAVLLALFFLSGCINMTVSQKLHRDGTSDITLEVTAESDALLNSLRNDRETEM